MVSAHDSMYTMCACVMCMRACVSVCVHSGSGGDGGGQRQDCMHSSMAFLHSMLPRFLQAYSSVL